ncbi:MAG: IS3 family transposase, partial [Acidobacteria bacterium]|nr:IS3 family transposase [Acidobacteriota bacterium]
MRAAGYSLRLVCQTLGVSRAGFYKDQRALAARAPRPRPDNEALAQRIRTILDREETFGYRRVWAWLRFKEGVVVNRKTVHRIMQLKGWQCRLWHRPAVRPKPTWVKCSTVEQPDQLWATDTTKVWCGQDGWASLVGVLDAGSRECVGARFARQGRAVEAVDALEQGIVQRYGSLRQVPAGLRLRHDNGSIFLARLFVGTAQQLTITQEFIPRYSPEYNGVIERFFRSLKQECVWLHHFESFEEAERIIMAWIERYNT